MHFQEQKLNECKVKIKLTGDYKNTLISMKMGGGILCMQLNTHIYIMMLGERNVVRIEINHNLYSVSFIYKQYNLVGKSTYVF